MAYRRIFATPRVLSLAASSVVARLPVGMVGVALVIYVHARTGSFGAAGAAAGAYTIGLGVTSPLLGRLVDRRGPRPVLLPAALASSAALVGIVALGEPVARPRRSSSWPESPAGRCPRSAACCATSGRTWSSPSCWSTPTSSTRS